jgi:undecaprenyl-diphosphatase
MNDLLFFLIIQIISESFPISSSGHFALLNNIFHFSIPQNVIESFDFFAHGPTVIIILIFFARQWWSILYRVVTHYKYRDSYKRLWRIIFKIMILTIFSSLIVTGSFYFGFKIFKKSFVLSSPFVLSLSKDFLERGLLLIGFLITTLSLFSLKLKREKAFESWNFKKALVLGIVQGTALIVPGFSRLATTYVAGRWMNLSQRRSFQISFLIQFFLIAAGFVKGLVEVIKANQIQMFLSADILITVLITSVVAYFGLRLVWYLAKRKQFWWFGFYELIPLGAMIYLVFLKN